MPIHLSANERPKVAVVLAGGGAKGVAHIKALKTIEEAGIPIDMIVGTSMGSIIGGMYCVGYSPDSMLTIVGSNDWIKLIMDNPDYGNNRISARMDDENYILRMSVDHKRSHIGGRAGVITGRNVMRFFRGLTEHLPDSIVFSDLPVQFACVATNAFTGEAKVFTEGNLPNCIRASMAIPTVFTPMHINGSTYIDGGIADNFPVDIARQMGADIVIGVNLVIPTTEEEMTNSAVDILMNVLDMNSQTLLKKNIEDADIYIPIDVTGFSAASFTKSAIDTLLVRGEYYSQLKADELKDLYDKLNLQEPVRRIRIGEYAFAKPTKSKGHEEQTKTKYSRSLRNMRDNYVNSAINLGARFDNDEYASILIGGKYLLNQKHATMLSGQIRLGQRMGFNVDLSTKTIGTQRIGTYYKMMHHDLTYYYQGDKAAQVNEMWHQMGFYVSQEFHKVKYSFGLSLRMDNYHDILARNHSLVNYIEENVGFSKFFSYYIESEYNSLDRQYFSTKGHQVLFKGELDSDNLYQYEGGTMIPIFSFFYQSAMSIGSRFTIRPHLSARVIYVGKKTIPLSMANYVGGFHRAMQLEQQMTMAGLPHIETLLTNGVGITGLTLQERIFHNHFACLRFDVSTNCNEYSDILKNESLNWGIQGSYSVRTGVGPITVTVGYNDFTKGVQATFNAGYCF